MESKFLVDMRIYTLCPSLLITYFRYYLHSLKSSSLRVISLDIENILTFITTKFHEILLSGFSGVALTRKTGLTDWRKSKKHYTLLVAWGIINSNNEKHLPDERMERGEIQADLFVLMFTTLFQSTYKYMICISMYMHYTCSCCFHQNSFTALQKCMHIGNLCEFWEGCM